MASLKELKIIELYAKLTSSLAVIGADWDPVTKFLRPDVSGRKKILNNALVFLCIFVVVFGGWRLRSSLAVGTSQNPIFMFHGFILICFLAIATMVLGFAGTRRNLVLLFNQLLILNRELASPVGHQKMHFVYATYMYVAACTVSIPVVVIAVEIPFAWSFFPSSICSEIMRTTFYSLSATVFYCVGGLIFGFLSTYVYLYFGAVKKTLELSLRTSTGLETQIHRYRSLSILCKNFNVTYCRWMVPFLKLLLSLIVMFCALLGIRLKGVESPVFALITRGLLTGAFYFFLLLITSANLMSGLWEMSSDFIWAFRYQSAEESDANRKKYIETYARSCLPLRFAIGNFYFMEREAKLTLAAFLITGTANLLVAFK